MAKKKDPTSKPGLHFYVDEKGEHRWKIVARNGRIIGASTEGYKRIGDCEANLNNVGFEAIHGTPTYHKKS